MGKPNVTAFNINSLSKAKQTKWIFVIYSIYFIKVKKEIKM